MLFSGAAHRWSTQDEDPRLLRGRYLQAGMAAGANPAYGQGAVYVEWAPIALLQLRAQYDLYGYFGRAGALVHFPSAASPFGDADIRARSGTESSGLGNRLLLSPVLNARLGSVLLRSQTDLSWWFLPPSSSWAYEPENDTLLADRDFVVANRSTVLVRLWQGSGEATLLAGPGYEVTHAARADLTRQRAEAVLYWARASAPGPFTRSRLLAVVGVNLVDRNHQGAIFTMAGYGVDLDL
jgi:hypothetical protein